MSYPITRCAEGLDCRPYTTAYAHEALAARRAPRYSLLMANTKSLLPGERQSWILTEPVVGLRIMGTSFEYLLAADREVVVVGSGTDCDICLDSPNVSRRHATIERRNGRWIVHDQGSRNGVFDGDQRRTMFELVPGKTFRVAAIPFVAFSDAGRIARQAMQRFFGFSDAHQVAVEGVLRLAAEQRHIILVQPPGCGGEAIARALHAGSPRATWPLTIVTEPVGYGHAKTKALLNQTAYGTLVLPVEHLPKQDKRKKEHTRELLDMLASRSYPVRAILIAPKGTRLAPLVGEELLTEAAIVPVPSIADRRADLDGLVSLLRHEACLRLGRLDLTLDADTMKYIRAHSWPENTEELERYILRALAVQAHGTIRRAAKAINVSPSTMIEWAKRHGIS